MRTELSSLQQSAALEQKQQAAVASQLERKVEESIAVSANSVTAVCDRSARLEEIMRDTELSMRSHVTDTKSEVSGQV